MKRIILLLVSLFLLSGCSVTYTVSIVDSQMQERIMIQAENLSESDLLKDDPWPIPAFYDAPVTSEEPVMLDGVPYLKKDVFEKNGYQNWLLSYDYQKNQYGRATSLHSCFESIYFDYQEDQNITELKTSAGVSCLENYPDISNLTIQVQTDHDILNHNADQVADHMLIWRINRTNYKTFMLQLSLQGKIDNENARKETNQDHTFLAFLVFGLFLFFIVGILIYNYQKRKNDL